MAYQQDEQDDEEIGQPGTGPESGGAELGGGAGGAAGGNAPSAAPAGAPQKQGNFVGINQYLDANKEQSKKLAGNVGGYVDTLSQTVRDTLPGQTQQFGQEVEKNTIGLDQGLFDEAKQNTAGVAGDVTKKQGFQKMRDAEYKGPQDLQSSAYFKPIEDSLKKAQQAGQNTTTEQGQRQLLGQFQQDKTGKTTGQGVTTFDQMLLQGGGGKERLAQAREAQADLPGLIDQAGAQSKAMVDAAKAKSAATRQAIADEFGQGASSQKALEQALGQKVQGGLGLASSESDRIANLLKGGLGGLSQQDRALLGISEGAYSGLRDLEQQVQNMTPEGGTGFDFSGAGTQAPLDFSQYLMRKNPGITAQNVASQDDYARYAALNDLMGSQGTFLSNPSLAGTASTDGSDLDVQGAYDFLRQKAGLQQQLNPYGWSGGSDDEHNNSWYGGSVGQAGSGIWK